MYRKKVVYFTNVSYKLKMSIGCLNESHALCDECETRMMTDVSVTKSLAFSWCNH